MTLLLGLAIITAAVGAILARIDVRLALVLAALALGTLAGDPAAVVRTFLGMLTREQFVVPICCAMGFAYVLRHTGCDQHLVHLLVQPLQRFRVLLVPGTVVVGFLVNIPVISQTSTAVAIGPVLIPILRAAHVSPVTAGAALLLGSSIGGELLNPGAPEFRTVSTAVGVDAARCVEQVIPLVLPHLVLATLLFWFVSARAEAGWGEEADASPAPCSADGISPFRVNLLKAAVPLLPITLLFLTARPFGVITVPKAWLVDPAGPDSAAQFDSRLIGAAMLVGVVAAALTAGRAVLGCARAFFEGAGYAFTHIISLIVTAACFGKGVEQIGLAGRLGDLIRRWPGSLLPTAGSLPLAFAWVCGSGMASTQSLFAFFVPPSLSLGADPVHVGAVVSIAAAAGRTMSPVAAVTLMCAALTETNPFDLIRRIALPLMAGVGLVILLAWLTV
jgi:DcuC family C4-dicarboxylate transporter